MPKLPRKPGCHRMTIRIANIGVKNPEKMIQPFLTVSVKGKEASKFLLLSGENAENIW